ncbi:hypothetical protein [Hymenobacter weizhouensis]|uniref:hypothetical protein n=1 Tax=Hymenobacter sp. YIM 151500-1 TaxID=2987689 RepID=UPI002226194D|nr:hypothetical protein [Hymenobacter sp. YIM 151500-1]UYZ62697.1 hypothetical protein OIS53_17065 [Hymenobacter sp. YIM 151500-1]
MTTSTLRFLLLAAAALGLPTLPGRAQGLLPVLDQTPASLPWYEVRTPHFRVLYPAGFAERARRTAHRLEQLHGPAGASLEQTGRPVTIVLQSQNTIGNGFVTLLPRRSEFYTTFPQDPFLVGTLDWLDQLAVHEYRHIVQYDKARQGVGRLAYALFGYGGLGLTTVGVPDWFAEGDAVGTETALSRSGRGRMPNFDATWRANLLAGRRYSYGEVTGGSFRRFVPNHYVLGYFLTTRLRRTASPAVWSQVLNRYYRFPAYPLSFSDKLRRATGLRTDDLYRRTERELDSTWRAEQARLTITPATEVPVAADGRVFTEYQFPQYLSNQTLVALKSGLGHVPQLVVLRGEGAGPAERRLHTLGLHHNPEQLSAGGGRVAWLEFRYDPRWHQRVYSELRVLDVATGRVSRPGRRTRYTTAVLSPDGRRLLAVSTDSAYQHRLHLLDAATGAELRTYPNPQNQPYLHPRFAADGRTAAVVRLEPAGKSLALLDVETGQLRTVLPAANDNLSHPQPWQEWVLFNSPRSGLDQVYAVHTATGEVRQVTERPVGAYHPAVAPDGRHLALHEVRAEGSRLIEMPLDPAQWRPVPALGATPDRYAAALVTQEPGAAQAALLLPTDSLAGSALVERRYRRLLHAPNVFSWGLTQSASGNGLDLGLRSQDVLSTTQAVAGVGFDAAERTSRVFADFSYQGLWPVLDLSVERGGRRVTGSFPSGDVGEDQWQYTRLSLGSRLPLVLTSSRMLTSLTVGAYYNQERTQGYELSRRPTQVGRRPLQYLTGSVAFARTLRQSYRDVGPRWGQTFSAVWRDTPFGGTGLEARQWAVQGSVFLPGLGRHHNLRLRAGYQRQQQREYRFGAAVFYPRGLTYLSFNQLTTYGAEYRLPLADVHWNLGRVLYVQRLKAAVFYDGLRGQGFLQLPRNTYYASGFDMSVVFNPLRLRTPLELGFRTVYDSFSGGVQVQPVVINVGF